LQLQEEIDEERKIREEENDTLVKRLGDEIQRFQEAVTSEKK